MKQPKFVYKEPASDTEAGFIFCTEKPFFVVKIHHFTTLKKLDEYITINRTIQVRKNLPMLLEVIQIEETYKANNFEYSLKRMADWYYYTHIKTQ